MLSDEKVVVPLLAILFWRLAGVGCTSGCERLWRSPRL